MVITKEAILCNYAKMFSFPLCLTVFSETVSEVMTFICSEPFFVSLLNSDIHNLTNTTFLFMKVVQSKDDTISHSVPEI